jgi:hypothetical protein
LQENIGKKIVQHVSCRLRLFSGKTNVMTMSGESPDGPAPFIFGVSGHRDLVDGDLPDLRKQLEIVFSRFRSAYPNARFELLSPLAEGADRVAAEVALVHGIKLLAPLPLPQAEYERDFASADSVEHFRRLLAAAASCWEVSTDGQGADRPLSGDARVAKYAAVGDYIARKSHVLILLWDGSDNRKIGGTAWVKKRRDRWVKAATKSGDAPAAFGYVRTVQIVTPRRAGTRSGRQRPRIKIIEDPPLGTQASERSRL